MVIATARADTRRFGTINIVDVGSACSALESNPEYILRLHSGRFSRYGSQPERASLSEINEASTINGYLHINSTVSLIRTLVCHSANTSFLRNIHCIGRHQE